MILNGSVGRTLGNQLNLNCLGLLRQPNGASCGVIFSPTKPTIIRRMNTVVNIVF